jgi:hypothetical protein
MTRSIQSIAAGLLLVVALAACSANAAGPSGVASLESQGTGAESSAEPSASLDPETAQLEFAKCMREHGIDMPDPETAPGGGFTQRIEVGKDDAEKMQAAQEACDHILANAGNFRGELDPEQLDKMVDFAQCMREHGIDMPDPATNGKGGIMFRSSGSASGGDGPSNVTSDGIDPASPEFQAAQEACQSILGSDFGPKFEGGPATQSGPGAK